MTDWTAARACADINPTVFFPEQGDNLGVQAAKAICATCPVRIECLDYAVDNVEQFGIWGGTTMRQRQRIRAQRRANATFTAPCAVCGNPFHPADPSSRLCSDQCRAAARIRSQRKYEKANA